VGFFTGAAQYASYAIAQYYFTPLVIASSYLIEPVIAQTLGCLFEIDRIPGFLTWFGALISLAGIFLITIGGFEIEKHKNESLIELKGQTN
jgi:drug/metabolite transporter (DMT)-like permease